jgi:quercetin dioxygenase-like cupin family protein
VLRRPRTLKVPLGSVREGELFAVDVTLDAEAVDERGRESGAAEGAISDPQEGGPPLLTTRGLKPRGRPRFTAPRVKQPRAARCRHRLRRSGAVQLSEPEIDAANPCAQSCPKSSALPYDAPDEKLTQIRVRPSRPREAGMFSYPRPALLAGAILLTGTAVVAYAEGAARRPPAQASRTVLAQAVDPPGGHGRTLGLARVRIPPHTRLALHRHPGVQLAYVQKGTLSYTVKRGVVKVYRGNADQDPVVARRISDGRSARVHAGEWVIERPGVVHFGANHGDRPVVILLATLFRNGMPSSIPVPEDRR